LTSDLKKWIELLDENKTSAMDYAEVCTQKEKNIKSYLARI
jgi:hypothetical protein